MSLKNQKVFFLDLQTTGAKPPQADILEMAWGQNEQDKITAHILQQENAIPRPIQLLTGISEADLASALAWQQVFEDFHDFIKSADDQKPTVVIHFAQFEKKFLEDIYARLQMECPFEILCTHEIAKRLLPNLPTRGIKGLAGYFGYPSQDLKRASSQVHATGAIWQGLIPLIEEKGFQDLQQIQNWLSEKEKTKRGKYEYPLAKEKRLGLPKKPGIYRMISRWGEVLYVGKATSLRDRVNSYFRGQKNRDSRKLEMLTQVWDLIVTPVETPLEAALLETDEIKRLNPRYNVSLKVGRRSLAFFNHDFTSFNSKADAEHTIGPFPNALTLDSMLRLRKSIQTGQWDENMFFDPFPPEFIHAGFDVFCQRHGFQANTFTNFRSLLAVGLNWYRKIKDEEVIEEDDAGELESTESVLPSFEDLESKLANKGSSLEEIYSDENEEVEEELTPEDMADKFERHFTRAAAAYSRTRKITKLLNAKLEIKPGYFLKIQNGFILDSAMDWAPQKGSWEDHSVETYDRMSVLFSELNKLKN